MQTQEQQAASGAAAAGGGQTVSADEPVKGLSVVRWDGPGYKPMVRYGSWCFAGLNHASKFAPENLSYCERHNRTDEAFVLVAGRATLLVGEDLAPVEMEPNKIYNVKAGTWHQIQTEPGTRVLIVENDDADAFSETRPAGRRG